MKESSARALDKSLLLEGGVGNLHEQIPVTG